MNTGEPELSPIIQYDIQNQRAILRIADEGFWEWDLDERCFWLNPFFSRLAGLDPQQEIVDAALFASLIHPEDRELFLGSVQAGTYKQAITTTGQFRLLSRDGHTYWIESKSKPVDFRKDGSPLRIIGHVFDITGRKPADEQLKKLNRALLAISKGNQALLRANNEMELLNEICGIIVEVGGYRMACVGYAQDDPGKTIRIVARSGFDDGYLDSASISWGDNERGQGPTGMAIRNGRHCVVHNMQADRSTEPWRKDAMEHGYASALSCPMKNSERAFGALNIYAATPDAFNEEETELLSSLADNLAYGISMLQNRAARKLAEKQLIEGNKRMHFILSAANAGIWEYEIGSDTAIWSGEVWNDYGIDGETRQPSLARMLETVIPEDREAVKLAAEKAFASGTDFSITWRTKDADGKIRWVMSTGTPFREADGTISRYLGIVVDITDRKKEEEKKHQLESQLRKAQRLETIGTLAGGIAHDFNNILTPILGYSEMGLLTFADDEAGQEYFREIMLAADRAKNLVSQILAFSKAQEITPSVVSVPAVVDEALKLLRPSIPASITISEEIEPSCGNILADPSQIHQVVVNLCTNASQAMGDAPGTIRIEVQQIIPSGELLKSLPKPHADRYVQLSIADTGIGMDEETIERIFEPFFTTKAPQKGTGLGLSVVHGIVTGYNGLITVHSAPLQGTAFRIYLPVVDASAEEEAAEQALATGTASIMFIDDEPASTRMISIMLAKLGFSIQAFNSPQEALDRFRIDPCRFDLVITDLTMPVMNGVDLATEIHAERPDLPIILMTGYGKDLESIRSANWHGIRKFLKKPVKMTELAATISEVITE